jgi:hypothetical protein
VKGEEKSASVAQIENFWIANLFCGKFPSGCSPIVKLKLKPVEISPSDLGLVPREERFRLPPEYPSRVRTLYDKRQIRMLHNSIVTTGPISGTS